MGTNYNQISYLSDSAYARPTAYSYTPAYSYQAPYVNSVYTTSNSGVANSATTIEDYHKEEKRKLEEHIKKFAPKENYTEKNLLGALNKKDIEYLKLKITESLDSVDKQSLIAAGVGGAGLTVMNYPRLLVHPINSYRGKNAASKIFADVKKDGTWLNKAWKSKGGAHNILEDAYAQMQKAEARANSKLGLFRKRYDNKQINALRKEMMRALKSNNIHDVALATEKLKQAYATNGWLGRGISKIPFVGNLFNYSGDVAENASKAISNAAKPTFKNHIKMAGGWAGAILMGIMEVGMDWSKIKAAFNKDTSTGMTQLGQTGLKAAASAGGFLLGQAGASLLWAKFGAAIGSSFPVVGTAIGAIVGFAAGSLVSAAFKNTGSEIAGNNVGSKVIAENKIKEDSLSAYIELAQQVESGAIKDEKLLKILQKAQKNPYLISALQEAMQPQQPANTATENTPRALEQNG